MGRGEGMTNYLDEERGSRALLSAIWIRKSLMRLVGSSADICFWPEAAVQSIVFLKLSATATLFSIITRAKFFFLGRKISAVSAQSGLHKCYADFCFSDLSSP